MKISTLLGALAFASLVLGIIGCDKTGVSSQKDTPAFGIIRSEASFDYKGGTGLIELSDGDFAVSLPKGSETWVTVTKIGTRALRLDVQPNASSETRNTLVTVDKTGEKVYVPVTQTGKKDFAALSDLRFKPEGGSEEFALDFDNKAEISIEGNPSWISVEVVDGKSLFVDVVPNTRVVVRKALVKVSAGLYEETFTVTQDALLNFKPGKLVYADILGSYTFTGFIGDEEYSVPVSVEALEKGKTVLMKGLAIDFVLEVDEAANLLRMKSNQILPEDVYYLISSGLGENQCSIIDLLGDGKAEFNASPEEDSGRYRFIFKSPNKANCEVKTEDENGELVGTGVFKEPTGVLLLDLKNNGFYYGPDGNRLGVFFNFYMIQD